MPTSVLAKFIELILGNVVSCNYVSFDHTWLTLSPLPEIRLLIRSIRTGQRHRLRVMGLSTASEVMLVGNRRKITLASSCPYTMYSHIKDSIHVAYTAGNLLEIILWTYLGWWLWCIGRWNVQLLLQHRWTHYTLLKAIFSRINN